MSETGRGGPRVKCFGLTTVDRTDRHDHIRSELGRTGLEFELMMNTRPADPGGFINVGTRGCFESHLAALRAARDEGLDVAVLVEDDATIVRQFPRLVFGIFEELEGTDWSMLLMGYEPTNSPGRRKSLHLITRHVARSDAWEFIGTHFVAVNGSALDAVIANLEQRQLPGGHRIPVDGAYNEFRHFNGYDTLVCVPNMSRQGASPSGIIDGSTLRIRLLHRRRIQRAVLAVKRVAWDVQALVPPDAAVAFWNVRAKLVTWRDRRRSDTPQTPETPETPD